MIEEEVIAEKDTALVQETGGELLPSVVRPEVNLLRFPFFALSWPGLKDRKETVFRLVEERNGEKAELEWRIMASAVLGHPSPFDRRVARAIDVIIENRLAQQGYPLENPIPFSIYRIGRIIQYKSVPGKVYKSITKSLKRIVAATVESKGTFFLKDRKTWIDRTFHPYEEVIFLGEEMDGGGVAEVNYLRLHDFYLRNVNAKYTRPLDYKYLFNLQNHVAGRLYEVLGSRFYGLQGRRDYCVFHYSELCVTLPIKEERYYSKARQVLDTPHKELMDTGFLAKVVYVQYEGQGGLKLIKYYMGERAKREKQGELRNRGRKTPIEEQLLLPAIDDTAGGADPATQLSPLAEELYERGIGKPIAEELADTYPEAHIREKISMHDDMKTAGRLTQNPAGFLRSAIEQEYEFSDEQKQKTQANANRKERETKEADRQERWLAERQKLITQELRDWDKNIENRIAFRFLAWLAANELSDNQNAEKAKTKKQEMIDGLPKTDEARKSYLASREYPTNPIPTDFK